LAVTSSYAASTWATASLTVALRMSEIPHYGVDRE